MSKKNQQRAVRKDEKNATKDSLGEKISFHHLHVRNSSMMKYFQTLTSLWLDEIARSLLTYLQS